jgi:hypothetical protein
VRTVAGVVRTVAFSGSATSTVIVLFLANAARDTGGAMSRDQRHGRKR